MYNPTDHPIETNPLFVQRRERVFLLLAGLFWGSLVMLNILGTSRFINLSEYIGLSDSSRIQFVLAVGVLPYPITFLCTDFISELYGRKRANFVVWIGLFLNLWVLFVLWLGGVLNPPDFVADGIANVAQNSETIPREYAFYYIRHLTFGATIASMIAYLCAQFVDVYIFHYLKQLTKGKKLWLRNNGSTLISQLVDTSAVILITYLYTDALPINERQAVFPQLMMLIASGYLFKLVVALLDTIPFIYGTRFLKKYLGLKEDYPA
jgi:queuosine precursor transporter